MTITELIDMMQNLISANPDLADKEVMAYDEEFQDWANVTGVCYSKDGKKTGIVFSKEEMYL